MPAGGTIPGPMARPYFPDARCYDENGHLYPFDVRYDPGDRAHCSPLPDGTVRFRVQTEPGFTEARVVFADGSSAELQQWGVDHRFAYWEGAVSPPARQFHYTLAFRDRHGRAVYLVPAGVSNAVERLDRWELDLDATPPLEVPEWAQGMVIYQIFPERFASGDAALTPPGADPWGAEPHWLKFQGGDLAGITQRLDHLADLGVDAMYLNPIFTSPSTHRYDAVDYYSVDPALGGNAGFDALVKALHDRDMRVIVDASFNHCSPRFFAFQDLIANGPESEHAGWFAVHDWPPRVIVRPHKAAGWVAAPGYQAYLASLQDEAGIAVEERTDDGPAVETTYEAWYGVPTLPRIELSHPDARAYFLRVAAHWLTEHDVDGWRMDVARYVDFDFWTDFRRACKAARPDAYLLAEVMGDAMPWLQGDRFDATMNYTFRALALDWIATRTIGTPEFVSGIHRMLARYAPEMSAASQNLLSSHDTPRFLHEAGGDPARLRAATLLQMTLPGAPGVYYGDEVGMTGGEEPASRGAFPWHDPEALDTKTLAATRALANLRRAHPALRRGDWRMTASSADAVAYTRTLGDERIGVVVNRGDRDADLKLAEGEVLWSDARAGAVVRLG